MWFRKIYGGEFDTETEIEVPMDVREKVINVGGRGYRELENVNSGDISNTTNLRTGGPENHHRSQTCSI